MHFRQQIIIAILLLAQLCFNNANSAIINDDIDSIGVGNEPDKKNLIFSKDITLDELRLQISQNIRFNKWQYVRKTNANEVFVNFGGETNQNFFYKITDEDTEIMLRLMDLLNYTEEFIYQFNNSDSLIKFLDERTGLFDFISNRYSIAESSDLTYSPVLHSNSAIKVALFPGHYSYRLTNNNQMYTSSIYDRHKSSPNQSIQQKLKKEKAIEAKAEAEAKELLMPVVNTHVSIVLWLIGSGLIYLFIRKFI